MPVRLDLSRRDGGPILEGRWRDHNGSMRTRPDEATIRQMSVDDLVATFDEDQLPELGKRADEALEEASNQAEGIIARAGDHDLTAAKSAQHDSLCRDMDQLGSLRSRISTAIESLKPATTRDIASLSASRSLSSAPRTRTPGGKGAYLRPEHRLTDWARQNPDVLRPGEATDLDVNKALRGAVGGGWYNASAEQRAMSEGTNTLGGYTVPTIVSAEILDLARNFTRVFQAGATTIPLESDLQNVPRETADPVATWSNEADVLSDGSISVDVVTFTARTLRTIVKVSNELLQDSRIPLEDVIKTDIAKAFALELDRVALRGSGTPPVPKGVLNQSGITTTTHGANGTAAGWDFLSVAAQTVRQNNFEPSAFIYNARTDSALARTKDSQNRYLIPTADVTDVPRLHTSQVPTNLTVGTSTGVCSEIYTAQWDQLLVGVRLALTIQPLYERFMDANQRGYFAAGRFDIQLAHPQAFVVDTGVL